MKKSKEGAKAKRSGHETPAVSGEPAAPTTPDQRQLVDLLEEISGALEQASELVATHAGAANGGVPRPSSWLDEPCGPSLTLRGSPTALVDPLLLDRYQGLLVRSGVVGDSVHHLPSRTRERLEEVLRDLVAGVSRGRPATGGQVEALVTQLVTLIGERIACTVEDWRDAAE